MKTILKLFLATLLIGFASCNFLDVVPVERPNDTDAFKDPEALKRYLYSCYAYLPQPRDGVNSLDFMTGDEVVTAFEHENFAHFPKGGYTAAKPRISYWNTLFQGIRQCYILKNNINSVPRLEERARIDYTAQADFLIGYFHYLLLRCYGPTIVVEKEPLIDTKPEDYLARSSLDSSVNFIVKQLDASITQFESDNGIEDVRTGDQFGLATAVIAKAIKAKLYLYVASPLFNGTEEVPPLFGVNGYNKIPNPIANLVPATYDVKRWEKARDAALEAINAAHSAGHKLYTNSGKHPSSVHPVDLVQRTLRYTICDREALVVKNELIWGDARQEGAYGLQKKSIPYWNNGAWNGVAPTIAMLNRFYTSNGLPIEHDATFPDNWEDLYTKAVNITDDKIGKVSTRIVNSVKAVLNREPRFYAWVAFNNGYYEVKGDFTENTAGKENHPYYKDNKAPYGNEKPNEAGRLYTEFTANGNCGRGTSGSERTTNYSLTGFLNKKGVHPDCTASGGASSPPFYHWPLIRLADLYLMYAEAAIECGKDGDDFSEACKYINFVRERAGLKPLEEVYVATNTNLKPDYYDALTSKSEMRKIVRRERMVELYLENQNFWDMRRWLLAGDKTEQWGEYKTGYFNARHQGCNIDATTVTKFCELKPTPVIRQFIFPTNYLLPIPIEELNKNRQLVQNPGY